MPEATRASSSAAADSQVPDSPRLPTTARGRRSRDAIIDAAVELMYERGITQASLDDVLERGGAGKSQLYHYFGGKQELVRAVIDRQLSTVLATEPTFDSVQSWADLQAWRAAFLARHSTQAGPLGCRLGKFAGELDGDEVLRPVLGAAFERWRAHITAAIGRIRDNGELDQRADADHLSEALLSAVQGGLLLGRLQRDVRPLERAIAMAMAYLESFRPH